MDVKDLFINVSASIHDALELLDKTGQNILFLVNDRQQLLRTVSDGDIRRLLLSGKNLNDTLSELPSQVSKFITNEADLSDAFALMDKYGLAQIPIVNQHNIPISLVNKRDIPTHILLSTPHLGEYETQFVAEAFKTNWIAPLGPNVDAFEKEMAEYVKIPYAAALSSGTAAIHLALRLLNVVPGDIVFCSSLTFVASANPILYQYAQPVFIDSEPASWNMSPLALARAFEDAAKQNKLPRVVIVVNLYGQSADIDPLLDLCNYYNVPLIEDAAESLGATYKGRASGTLGKLGIYSFNGNKIITTSGGGMLVSEDEELIRRAKFLSTQARDTAPHYEHSEVGYNYRMSNVLAGIGRGQLKVLEDRIKARRAIFERYAEELSDIDCIGWMPETSDGRSTRWLSAMMVQDTSSMMTSSHIIKKLAAEKIEARPVWKPMHLQPLFKNAGYYPHQEYNSISDTLFKQGICLPSGSNLTEVEQSRVIHAIRSLFKTKKSISKIDTAFYA